jgi:hypothetical protein
LTTPSRLSCRSFAAKAVCLQPHGLAYLLGNFLRTLATLETINDWPMKTLREKLMKIGATVIRQAAPLAYRWPRSPRQGLCLPRSCGSSPNCVRYHPPAPA